MAHELEKVLQFFKSFGDDNFRHPANGSVHAMKDYVAVLKKFIDKEVEIVKGAAAVTAMVGITEANVVREVVKETVANVAEAKKELTQPSPAPVAKV